MDEQIRLLSQDREPKGGPRALTTVKSGVRYAGVSFAYTEGTAALRDIKCEIPAGRMTALVGPSGSGKSTFIDLLPRLRDPNKGTIFIDDVALGDYAVNSLRAGIAFVPQAPQIFNVSAAAHIRYGRQSATDAEIRNAARLAGAAAFIEALPEGYNTVLGEGGQKLSGGQRQRLDIARALVRQAPILIFDEPTSQLDADSEQQFRDALRRIRSETSALIIIVGHRLSTVAEADQILVFSAGTIVDSGSHSELIQRGGWYASAFLKQHGPDVADHRLAVIA